MIHLSLWQLTLSADKQALYEYDLFDLFDLFDCNFILDFVRSGSYHNSVERINRFSKLLGVCPEILSVNFICQ